MSKAGTQSTPTIDYNTLADKQLKANLTTGSQTAALDNVNTYSPIGSSIYTGYGTGPDGIGYAGYNLNTSLKAPLQDIANTQENLTQNTLNTADNTLGPAISNAIPKGGLDFSGLADLPTSKTDFSKDTTDAENAAYKTYTRYLDPKYTNKRSDLSQTLADQGISLGSDAYDRAQGDLNRQESFDYGQAADQAVTAGQKEQYNLFGENLSSRKQGVAEAEDKYTLPLTTLGTAATDLTSLGKLGDFSWEGNIPSGTTGYTIPSTNVNDSAKVSNDSYKNAYTSGSALNTSLFNGLGYLGGLTGSSSSGGGLLSGLGSLLGFGATTAATGGLY